MRKKSYLIVLRLVILSLVVFSIGMGVNTKVQASNPSKSTVFALYNKVKFNMSKSQVDAALGKPTKETQMGVSAYNYMDKKHMYGVSVMYDDKNLVTSKTVIYQSHKDIAPFCKKPISESLERKIKRGMNYSQVKALLGGDGVEVSTTVFVIAKTKVTSYIYRWANKDGSCIQLVVDDKSKVGYATYFRS